METIFSERTRSKKFTFVYKIRTVIFAVFGTFFFYTIRSKCDQTVNPIEFNKKKYLKIDR